MLAGYGKLIANKLLKFPRGTKRSAYTQLYVAFFLSALVHLAADFMLDKRMAYRSFKFLLYQAVAITIEDFVIAIAKRSLLQKGTEFNPERANGSWGEAAVRVVGYCWVTLWFCLTFPGWQDELNVLGFGNIDRGPVTQFLLDRWKQWA